MKKALILMILALGLSGCMILSRTYKLGNDAEINKNFDEAVKYYERATLEHPREPIYRLALARAKFSATMTHLQQARKLASLGKKKKPLKNIKPPCPTIR